MITREILAFIQQQDAKGVTRESTRFLLMSQGGWTNENIDEAFAAVPAIYAAPNAQTPRPPEIVTGDTPIEKESTLVKGILAVFITLFVFAALGAAAYFFVPSIQEDIAFISSVMNQK